MIGLTTASTALTILLQALIFIAYYKGYKSKTDFDLQRTENFTNIVIAWVFVGSIWLVSSTITAFVYVPYDGKWSVDSNFVETSMQRNIFYMVQGFPIVPMVIGGLILVIYFFGKCLRWCFCSQLSGEIKDAQNKVAGYTIRLDETTPITQTSTSVVEV